MLPVTIGVPQGSILELLLLTIYIKLNIVLKRRKSKYMILHVPRKETHNLTFKIDNINIEQVEAFYFLGLTLNTNLTWQNCK